MTPDNKNRKKFVSSRVWYKKGSRCDEQKGATFEERQHPYFRRLQKKRRSKEQTVGGMKKPGVEKSGGEEYFSEND